MVRSAREGSAWISSARVISSVVVRSARECSAWVSSAMVCCATVSSTRVKSASLSIVLGYV